MPPEPGHEGAFEALRPKLVGIAYRMLQTRSEAEDAVQDAWLRLQGAGGVGSVEGFLVTAVTRICIDRLRSARVRRESYVGPWLPEPSTGEWLGSAPAQDPESATERAEAISFALLRVLDRLDPVERAVFLLREVFAYPYADVARIVGRREDHCRQIARRASERVRSERPRIEAGPDEHRRLVERFMAAAAEGDLAALEGLLADDVVLYSDGGGKAVAARRPVLGPDRVARFVAGIAAKAPRGTTVELAVLNGYPAAVVRSAGHVEVTVSLDVVDGLIRQVFMVRNPDKLGGV